MPFLIWCSASSHVHKPQIKSDYNLKYWKLLAKINLCFFSSFFSGMLPPEWQKANKQLFYKFSQLTSDLQLLAFINFCIFLGDLELCPVPPVLMLLSCRVDPISQYFHLWTNQPSKEKEQTLCIYLNHSSPIFRMKTNYKMMAFSYGRGLNYTLIITHFTHVEMRAPKNLPHINLIQTLLH